MFELKLIKGRNKNDKTLLFYLSSQQANVLFKPTTSARPVLLCIQLVKNGYTYARGNFSLALPVVHETWSRVMTT